MVKWQIKHIKQLKNLWNKGKKIKDIAEIMGRTDTAVAGKINTLQQRGDLPYRHKGKKSSKDIIKEKKALKKERQKTLKQLINYPGITEDMKNYPQYPWKKISGIHGHAQYTATDKKICLVIDELEVFLLTKNKQYGDSALSPIRIFSKADKTEQLKVRIDDKLNRLVQGDSSIEADEDVIRDLIGYFILLLIQMRD